MITRTKTQNLKESEGVPDERILHKLRYVSPGTIRARV